MELPIELVWAFAAGSAVAAAAGRAFLSVTLRHLRADLGRAQEAERARYQELSAARGEAEAWRERLAAEQLTRAASEAEARRVVELQPEVLGLRSQLAAAMVEAASLKAQLAEQAQAHGEKLALLGEVRGGIEKDFKALAVAALQASQGTFVELANAVFERHKAGADADLEGRRRAVEALVAPLHETLQSCREQVESLERSRAEAYGALTAEIRGVVAAQNAARSETAKLVNALRAAPKTRGRWGEQTLKNVLELSGLSAHCDFSTQEGFVRGDGFARPDVVIRLPGGRSIVVDAKTSLSAYLDAAEATDDSERERLLDQHAAQLRAHVRGLAGKAYQDLMPTPDFVVMFVPGDNFYAAAAERDPTLFEDAAAQGVVIVTPATLIALAKAVAFGWRQEKVAENAQAVHDLGRELYRRLSSMGEHIARCGDALGRSVQSYNRLVGSLEHSVMPQARRFHELEVEGTGAELPLLPEVELQPRLLRPEAAAKAPSGTAQAA